jgi:hypothetical protein
MMEDERFTTDAKYKKGQGIFKWGVSQKRRIDQKFCGS